MMLTHRQPIGYRPQRRAHKSLRRREMRLESLEARQVLAADVVISEVMYHPANGSTTEEFIELFNRGDEPANLENWRFSDGVEFTFGAVTLDPGQYLAVVPDLAVFGATHPPIVSAVGPWTGSLSNSSEDIELQDANGSLVDHVLYADEGDWAKRRRGPLDNNHMGWVWVAEHDGGGRSMELINTSLDNDFGQNWAASTAAGGTAGSQNSVHTTTFAPLITDLSHSPAIPRSTDSVAVTVDVLDQVGSGVTVILNHRIDGAGAFTESPMFDDGLHGDGAAGDGEFGLVLPPQANGTVVEFFVEASHTGGAARTLPGPSDDLGNQAANALYQVDDSVYSGREPIYRIVMTEAERQELQFIGDIDRQSNAQMNATFISTEGSGTDVQYNIGIRLRGNSSRSFNIKSYRINFHSDEPWQDVTALNLNARSVFSQVSGSAIFTAAGLPAPDASLAQVRVNGVNLAGAGSYAQLEAINGEFVDEHFPDDSEGNLYRKRRPPNNADTKWAYRNGNVAQYLNDAWTKETNSGANDWTDLNEFLRVINQAPDATYLESIGQVINVDQWLRYFALMSLLDNNETSPSNGADDDYSLYRGITDPRFVIMPHDIDSILGFQGSNPTNGIFRMLTDNGGLPQLQRFFAHPEVANRYYQALLDLMDTVFSPGEFNPLLDNLLGGIVPQATINAMKNFAAQRMAYVRSIIPTSVTALSSLPIQSGYRRTTEPTAVLSGVAPAETTRRVLVNGEEAGYLPQTGAWITASTVIPTEILIPQNSVWKYHDQGIDLGTNWRGLTFDDTSWTSGAGPLGYSPNGVDGEVTRINCGASAPACNAGNIPTYYFRHAFNVGDPARFSNGLIIRVRFDDGVAVYLNGTELARRNITNPNTPFANFANAQNADEQGYAAIFVPATALVTGNNVIAAEVKQINATSSDVGFDLQLEGVLVEVTSVPLVSTGATWRYLDNGSNQGTAWIQPTFNDSTWSSGPSPLGYGDGDEATVVSFGPSSSNKYVTTYFRHRFQVTAAEQITSLRMRLQRDDGAAVYLNGTQIARNNLAANAAFNAEATGNVGGAAEAAYLEFTLPPTGLREGENVLAVEIHQDAPDSTDISFDLELFGQQISGGGEEAVDLLPGINRVLVQALDESGRETSRNTIDIWYDDGAMFPVSGAIAADTTWAPASGPYRVTGNLTINPGVTLTIQPGTSVFVNPGASINVAGRIMAEGTEFNHIRFAKFPGAAGSWNGLLFTGAGTESRFADVDFEGADGSNWIGVGGGRVVIDTATFGPATQSIIALEDDGAVVVRNSIFPAVADNALISISGLPAAGELVIEGNTFPTSTGTGDAIEVSGGVRPGAIAQILNNRFLGSAGRAIDLHGADAHIEGNTFLNYQNATNSTVAVASAGAGGIDGEVALVRNGFFGNDTAVLVTDGSHLDSQHNSFVGSRVAAVAFDSPGQTAAPGAGADIVGSVFWNNAATFTHAESTQLSVAQSILPAAHHALGPGNLDVDPRLVNAALGDFGLRPGSPARRSGPLGLDRGASAPAGAAISGEPAALTYLTDATLAVGGPGITHYRWRLDGGAYSAETAVGTPISLSGLAAGPHTVDVIGKNTAGVWQAEADATHSKTWTVDPNLSRLLINEVLADNDTVLTIGGGTPDVVELYNDGTVAIDLSGYSLSDTATSPDRYQIPAGTTLGPGEYFLLYAGTGLNPPGRYLGFALDDVGETLTLFSPNDTAIDTVTFGRQLSDTSIGRTADGEWTLTVPSLGAANVPIPLGDPRGLVINEWLADPDRLLDDDFIEIYNPDSAPVELSGLYLTDNPAMQPRKQAFAPLSFIAADGLALYFANDQDEAGVPDRLDFRLSPRREAIALTDANGDVIDLVLYVNQTTDVSQGRGPNGAATFQQYSVPTPDRDNPDVAPNVTPIVAIDHVWRYEQSGNNLGSSWREPGFNDTAWPQGAALHYNEDEPLPGPKNTPLNLGFPTYYFRTTFDAAVLPAGVQSLSLALVVDDGAIVYLNGQEIVRVGMDPGPVNYFTFANRNVPEGEVEGPFIIPASLLAPGQNVLAVEVHQSTLNSTDVAFGATLDAVIPATDNSANIFGLLDNLRVTELMYNAPGGSDFDWVELQNVGDVPLDLTGVRLTNGIDFEFGEVVLVPGEFTILVRNVAAFQSRYGTSIAIGGTFNNLIGNTGENIEVSLPAPLTGRILDFRYADTWYPSTDGGGRSLVIRDSLGDTDLWDLASGWRASYFPDGTPGSTDGGQIVITEASPHATGAEGDWIEIHNTTNTVIDLGFWYLSDDPANPTKYQFPFGTTIAPDGYLVLTHQEHFGDPSATTPFSLADHGGTILLTGWASDGTPTGYVERLDYGAVEADRTVGPFAVNQEATDIVRFASATLGAENSGPTIGPITINEIVYAPAAGDSEFIELRNDTAAISLHEETGGVVRAWRISGAVDFAFPAGAVIPAGGLALVVPGDPAAFRTEHSVPASVPIFGPYTGDLADTGETIRLTMPGAADGSFVPDILVEQVAYTAQSPWPELAGTLGAALNRTTGTAYGNDPLSWQTGGVGGTPGTANRSYDTSPPTAPTNLTATVASAMQIDLAWTAASDPESGIARYNVYRDGQLVATVTGTTYQDTGISAGNSYTYEVAAVSGDLVEGPVSTPADVTLVGIRSIGALDATRVLVVFTAPLVEAVAEDVSHYSLAGTSITAASLAGDDMTLTLTTGGLTAGTNYTLTVTGLIAVSGDPVPAGLSASFTAVVAGLTVRDVHAASPMNGTLAEAEALLALPPGHPAIASERTGVVPVFDMVDPDSTYSGYFSLNQPFPNNQPGIDDDFFAINAHGTFHIPTGQGGNWTFGTRNDDGMRMRIDGDDVIVDPTGHGALDLFARVNLTPGFHTIEVNFFDYNGGTLIEVYAARGSFTAFTDTNAWRILGDTANGGLSVTTLPPPAPLADWERIGPAGGMVFELTESETASLGTPATFEWSLLGGQTFSLTASATVPTSALSVFIETDDIDIDFDGRMLTAIGAAGQPILVNNFQVPADGVYRVRVVATEATTFDLRGVMNASIERDDGIVYASRVIGFSTEYNPSPSSWSAFQVLGEPNTFDYGDIVTSWAPQPSSGTIEHITVGFPVGLYATGALIRETYGNGFVTKIDAIDPDGAFHEVWSGTDPSQPGQPVDFRPTWPQTTYLVHGLKVTVDTNHGTSWEEIDAIGLVGTPAPQGNNNNNNNVPATGEAILGSTFALASGPSSTVSNRLAVVGTTNGPTSPDYFAIPLSAGQGLSLALSYEGTTAVDLRLVDATDQILGVASNEAGDVQRAIRHFVAPSAGTYYARVSGAGTAYTLVATRGGDFDIEPNSNIESARDITWAGSVLGSVGAGTIGAPGTGGSTPVNLQVVLNDGENFRWDIGFDGSISDGTSDAYDGGMANQAYQPFTSTGVSEDNGREIVLNPYLEGNITLQRKIYIPANQGYARFLEIITNNGPSPTNVDVPIYTNLGSDGITGELITTSSGDAVFNTADDWILTDDGDGSNDPTMLHIVANEGGLRPVTAAHNPGEVRYNYSVPVRPGETKIVMHFAAQSANRAAARTKAADLVELKRGALDGLSDEEREQIVNFNIADAADWYTFEAGEGDEIELSTLTPGVGFVPYGPGAEPTGTNSLDPLIEVFGPDGQLLASDDNSQADARNAHAAFTAPWYGTYSVRVAAVAGSGEYVLHLGGSSEPVAYPRVLRTEPADGARFLPGAFPTTLTVHLSEPVNPATVAAGDLQVNGVPATAVTTVDGDTLRFTINPSVNQGARDYTVTMPFTAVTAVSGLDNLPYSGEFTIDASGPRIESIRLNGGSYPADGVLPPGPAVITVSFDEPLQAINVNQFTPFYLEESNRQQFLFPGFSLDATGRVLTLDFGVLAEGQYTLRIASNSHLDLVGNRMDGEPNPATADGTVTGDGSVGGDYAISFTVDAPVQDLSSVWQRLAPAGSLVLEALSTGNVTTAGDIDAFEFEAATGERLSVTATPQRGLAPLTITLRDSEGAVVATHTAATSGAPAVLSGVATTSGRYRVEVTSAVLGDNYDLRVSRNSAIEASDSSVAVPGSLEGGQSTVAGPQFAVTGNSAPRAVGAYLQSFTQTETVFFPNILEFTFVNAGRSAGDAVLNISTYAYLGAVESYLSLRAEGLDLGDVFVGDGNNFDFSNASVVIPSNVMEQLTADGVIHLTVTPSSQVFNIGNTQITVELSYASGSLVWGVQPATAQIVIIDAESGARFGSFPAPGNLQPGHTRIGLTAADGGNALLYINSDDDPHTIYRLDPTTGQVLGTSAVTGENYDGLGFDGNVATRTIYEANMDTRPNGTYQGQWNWGRPTGGGQFVFDPTTGHTGNNVVGYNINGDYQANITTPLYFTTAAIDARGYEDLTLSFHRWLIVEPSSNDRATIEISNNGTSWTEIWRNPQFDFTFDQSWVPQTFALPPLADNTQTLFIRWGMGPTNQFGEYPGWNLDDIRITGRTIPDSKIFLSQDETALVRQEGYGGALTADWATGTPTGAVAGDDTGRAFANFTDGMIHQFDPDTDTNGYIGAAITPPQGGVEGLAFDGGYLFVSTASGELHILDPDTGESIVSRTVSGGPLYGLAAGARLAPLPPVTVVPQGSTWRYFDQGQDLGTAWQQRDYNDSVWSSGPGRLGYSPNGQDGEVTTVGFGPDANNKYTTTYFRHHFPVADPSALTRLSMSVQRDDGIAVYLNGVEVARDNLAFGATYSTFADFTVSGTGEQTFIDFQVDPSLLVAGDNVLAVEIHQGDLTSTDLGFDLRMTAAVAPRRVADVDVYSVDLTDNGTQPIDVLLASIGGTSLAGATLELVAPDGTVLHTGTANPLGPDATSYDIGILGVTVPPQVYTVRVSSAAFGRYSLVINPSDVFESEPNNAATDALRDISVVPVAQGFLDVSTDRQDGYRINLSAGQIVRLSTELPLDGVLASLSTLDPELRLYDPSGALVAANDDGAADGLNARLVHSATTAGAYRVVVVSEAGRGDYRLTSSIVESTAPQIAEISIGSSQWTSQFTSHLLAAGRGTAGYSIAHNSPAFREVLPWTGLDRIAVRFDRDVNIAGEHLRLRGDSATMPGITGFTYDQPTLTAIWTLSAPLVEGNYYVELADAAQSSGGIQLDGDGDTQPGGVLARRFGVMFGDADHSGSATIADVIDVRNRVGTTTAHAGYSPRADLDGSGAIDESDRNAIHRRLNRRLPAALPPALVSDAGFELGGDPENNERILTGILGVAGMGLTADLNHDGIVNEADLALLTADPPSPAAAPAAVVDRALAAVARESSPATQRTTRSLRASRQPISQRESAPIVSTAVDAILSTQSLRRAR
jgi:spore coat protein CotH